MSEFSSLLSTLMNERGITVPDISKYCETDRSTMYKYMKGKRTPTSIQLIRKMAGFMNLTPCETKELIESFQLTREGWNTYYRRKNIMEFILNFSEIQSLSEIHITEYKKTIAYKGSGDTCMTLSGMSNINNAVHKILEEEAQKENAHISLFVQPEYDFLFTLLASIGKKRPNLQIDHMICLNNSNITGNSQPNYNLLCLQKIVLMYGCSCNYFPHYYYDNVNSHFNNLNLFPYMILTEKHAIMFSSDITNGIMFHSKESIHLLQQMFQNHLSQTSILARKMDSLFVQCDTASTVTTECEDVFIFQAEPCLAPFITAPLIEKYIKKIIPDRIELINTLKNYYQDLFSVIPHQKINCFFTKEGILNFLNTGEIGEIPSDYYRAVEFQDRITLLKKLYGASLKNNYYLLKNGLEQIPTNLHIFVSSMSGYILFSDYQDRFTYLILEEPSLRHSLVDFMSSLDQHELVYSREESTEFLKQVLTTATEAAFTKHL